MRNEKLAWTGTIIAIDPIEKADRIEAATVVCGNGGKWCGVVQKGRFKVGDSCEVYLQDSIVPQDERFAFMEKNKYRIRMQRLRGMPSECLIMPPTTDLAVGTDITDVMKVERYVKQMPACLSGDAVNAFPSFVPKTDEINFQSAPPLVEAMRGEKMYVTVKADGTSSTAYSSDESSLICGHKFGVCTRNWEMKEFTKAGQRQVMWEIARKFDLEKHLSDLNIAMQWETVGPGIQKNALKLAEIEPRLFDIYDIGQREYWEPEKMLEFAASIEFPTVQVIECGERVFDMTDEEMRVFAEGKYPGGGQREGIVIRPMRAKRLLNERVSFKVLNLKYKE
jgi:RNA ligase (TIGR02306 family)